MSAPGHRSPRYIAFSVLTVFIHASPPHRAAGIKLYVPGQYGSDASFISPSSPMAGKRRFLDTLTSLSLPALRISVGCFPQLVFTPGMVGFKFPAGKVDVIGSLDAQISFTTPEDTATFLAALLTSTSPSELVKLGHVAVQGDRVSFSDIIAAYEASHPGETLEVTQTELGEAFKLLPTLQGFAQMATFMRVEWAKGEADVTRGGTVELGNGLVPGWKPTTVAEYLATL